MTLTVGQAAVISASKLAGDYIGVFYCAFAATFVVCPVLRWLAVRNGIVDRPDLARKNHVEPVAYLGGVALFLGWMGGVLFSHHVQPVFAMDHAPRAIGDGFPLPIIFGATVVMLTGLIDDVYGISPRVKIGGQFMAAAALAWSGQNLGIKLVTNTLAGVGVPSIPFVVAYVLGGVLIVGFVVGGCNSMNLLDGLDGLAAGVSAIVCVGFLFIAVKAGATLSDPEFSRVPVITCLAMLGAVLGFLPYNFSPAQIFMGDAGSLLLGYLCVSTILLFADAPRGGPVLVAAALIVYALPITDMFVTVWRRALQGQPLSRPDKSHLHHCLLAVVRRRVASPTLCVRASVVGMYGLAGLFAVLGCSLVFVRWRYVVAVFLSLFGFLLVGAYKSGRRQALFAKGILVDAADASAGGGQEVSGSGQSAETAPGS